MLAFQHANQSEASPQAVSDSQRTIYSVELDAVRLEFECHQEQRLRENSLARKKWLALVIANVAFKVETVNE